MAQLVGGPWPSVGKLIELFTAMGCELHDLPGHIRSDERGDTWAVRYLFNPETEGFQSLSDLDNEDHIPWSEVEGWERRLGIYVPRPGSCH